MPQITDHVLPILPNQGFTGDWFDVAKLIVYAQLGSFLRATSSRVGCKADALNPSMNLLGKETQKFYRLQTNTWQSYNVVKSLSLKVHAHELSYK
jgi:hypothetical protein